MYSLLLESAVLNLVTKINDAVNGFVWGWPALILLAGVGVLMTILTKVFQISHIGHWFKNTIGDIFSNKHVTKHTKDKSISQFQALCTALAATVGTGNIVGVASAIVVGGPGAVFWMWIVAILGMMTNFSENLLGIYYRRKNAKGEWSGGPMYYLKDGLGAKRGLKWVGTVLAVLFSAFCVLASFGIGNMTQVNSITTNIANICNIAKSYYWIIGVIILVAVGLVVIGGLKRIAAVTEKIVPFMVVLYIIGAIVIVCANGNMVSAAFGAIFEYAFGIKAVAGGAVGAAVAKAVEMGMKRGVFSNEAGLGSSVMVHSSSNVREPVRQGMWGIFEVFADTIIVCTLTALVCLTSGLIDLGTGELSSSVSNASVLVSTVFSSKFGSVGGIFIAVALALFAYSTVLGWSHYGSKAWEYLFGTKSTIIYKVVFVAAVMLGAILEDNIAWDLADTFNGLMMIPNLIGVLVLSPVVFKVTKNYVDRRLKKIDVEPMLSYNAEIQAQHAADLDKGML